VSGAGAAAEIPSLARDLSAERMLKENWRARRDSNLRRFAGVSGAGARSRNPEPGEGSRLQKECRGKTGAP
jgi:hypothetical protein